MPLPFVRGRLLWKPQPGCSINWDHPLALNLVGAWLFNENTGNPASLITTLDNWPLHGAGSWITGQPYSGVTLQNNSLNSSCQLTTPSALLKPTAQVSMHFRGAQLGAPTGTDNVAICSMAYTNSNTTPFWAYGIHRDTTDKTALYWLDDAGGTSNNIHAASLLNSGTPSPILAFDATLTYDGVNVNGYFNGVSKASHARTGSLSYASSMLNLGTNFSNSTPNTAADLVLIYARGLTPDEVAWLHNEPYAMIAPATPRVRFFFGAHFLPAPLTPWLDPQIPQLLAQ